MRRSVRGTPRPATLLDVLVVLAVLGAAGVLPVAQAQEGVSGGVANIFSDTEEVHVVNVDVVVTDAEGRQVTGLTPEDFQLFEDGRPVEISNFYPVAGGRPVPAAEGSETDGAEGEDAGVSEAEAGDAGAGEVGASPSAPAPFHLVVFVDNVHLRSVHRNRVLDRLEEYLTENWRPGMSAMLVSNERALEIRQPFTGHREDLLAALDDLTRTASRSSRLDQDREALLEAIGQIRVDAGSGLFETKVGLFGRGRAVGEESEQEEGPPAGSMTQGDVTAMVQAHAHSLVPQLMAYAQARNDEVLGSLRVLDQLVDMLAGLPGRKALLHVSDGLSVNPAEAMFEAFHRMFEVLPEGPGLVDLSDEVPRYNLISAFRSLTDAANAGRVSLYTLDASPPEAVSRGGAENANEIRNLGFSSAEERNEQDSLVLLAEETGGRVSLSNVTLDATVNGLFDDFESYYSLGYQADREPGRERHIEVRLKDPGQGVTVRHRKKIRDRTPEELMTERTLAALVLGSRHNPLEVKIEALTPQPAEGGNFLVPVRVRIPLGKLVLVPGSREHEARVSLYVAAADARGRTSEVMRQVCPIRIPNSELLVALGGHAECGVRLLMEAGEQRVAVGVRDELSAREATLRLEVEVSGPRTVDGAREGAPAADEVGR